MKTITMLLKKTGFYSLFLLIVLACASSTSDEGPTMPNTDAQGETNNQHADIVSVQVTGTAKNYSFSVGIKSPDTGCGQYADWWEVITDSGALVYRRILTHSHVGEQPFVRSGGPVTVEEEDILWIRAHMNNTGYGGVSFKGSVKTGFEVSTMPDGFASTLASEAPLPNGCG